MIRASRAMTKTSKTTQTMTKTKTINDRSDTMNLKTIRLLALAAAALAYGGLASAAVHAPAASTISNTATVNYEVGGNPQPPEDSNQVDITVDELIDVSVVRQSANPVTTLSPASDQPIRFDVTNLGNGSEQFNLTGNLAVGGDDFDPTGLQFYVDDGDNVFEPGAGDGAPVTSITLAGEAVGTVWFVADIPAALNDADTGDITMTATSDTGTGVAGTVFAGAGTSGVDAVIGTSTGADTDVGGYLVANITITVTKASQVDDQFGGNQPVPGATITYTVTVTTAGSGQADNVEIVDAIPANTTYVANSMTLNAVADPDADAVGDDCDFGVTTADTVTCTLGSLTGATTNTLTFEVTID